jgi:hypothetical protein
MLIRPAWSSWLVLTRLHNPVKATESRGSCFYKVTATKALVAVVGFVSMARSACSFRSLNGAALSVGSYSVGDSAAVPSRTQPLSSTRRMLATGSPLHSALKGAGSDFQRRLASRHRSESSKSTKLSSILIEPSVYCRQDMWSRMSHCHSVCRGIHGDVERPMVACFVASGRPQRWFKSRPGYSAQSLRCKLPHLLQSSCRWV